ncbi:hypothetical protein TSUD_175240 [Trifolium subterraneum]|uniref:Reverse transcriptase zinc-binding domain-containing protein n=1 Tax=Trifolium subterraneum TaxID=3900 RepID=A0A2Z6M3I7_TRISU|nr:hypothetical protein TSUD_175240 [Trifolium subterraneum]
MSEGGSGREIVVEGREHLRVASLINHQTGEWKHDMMQQLFNAQDINDIRKIRLNLLHINDQPIWRYSSREENEWHCFFGCTTASDVWHETEVWQLVSIYIDAASGFVSMVFDMLEKMEDESMAKIVMILWTLWWRRNQKCWNEKTLSVLEVTRRAKEVFQDWQRTQRTSSSSTRETTTAASITWSKPRTGSLKCMWTLPATPKRIHIALACVSVTAMEDL